MTEQNDKLDRLNQRLLKLGRVVVAVSGGVDSAVLFKAATLALGRDNALGVSVRGDIFPSHEADIADAVARAHGLNLEIVKLSPMRLEQFRANPPDRCYYCKTFLFSLLKDYASRHGVDHVVEGSNVDDLGDHRPGMRALTELEILSPLLDAGLGKADIRALAHQWGLDNWDEPSAACLASRIPYGVTIDPERLARIDRAEQFLRRQMGLRQVRVRYDGVTARIEVLPADIASLAADDNRTAIVAALREMGFQFIALDLMGYRMGSHNEALKSTAPGNQP